MRDNLDIWVCLELFEMGLRQMQKLTKSLGKNDSKENLFA